MASKNGDITGLDRAAGALVGLGALNWGLIGLAGVDAIRMMLGKSKAARAVYTLVGASAAYAAVRGARLARR
jgi:uncharacterized membrane protein YuzA (DUF378 family)